MTISKIEFDFKNPFMPKKPVTLTKNQEAFLNIYSVFAKNMNYLHEFQEWEGFRGSPQCIRKEEEVIQNAEAAIKYLKDSPLHNGKVTEEMIQFLTDTSKSLRCGEWLGEDFLSKKKDEVKSTASQNLFIQLPTHEPEVFSLGTPCQDKSDYEWE